MGSYTFFADRPVEKYRKSDTLFIIAVLILWGLGIFTLSICTTNTGMRLFDDKYYFLFRQLICSAIGFALLIALSIIPVQAIRKAVPVIVIGSLVLCAMTHIPGIGDERKGAARWIRIPHVMSFQPSELAKFAMILFLANLFDNQKTKSEISGERSEKEFIYPLGGLLLFVLVIFLQKDFSTSVLVFAVGAVMFFVSGVSMTWFIPLMLLAIPACVLMICIEPYRLLRVVAFFKPDEYTLTSGYQQFASQRAITAGGFWGSGMGTGLDKIYSIPEVQTDYIFAGWTNSMGLIGVTVYLCVLAFFAWRGYRISVTCPDRFASYSAFGCTTMIIVQSLMNCAVVCGAAPTTGIPLPFFSSGGSSLIVTLGMCGFIINASHCDKNDDETYGSSSSIDGTQFDATSFDSASFGSTSLDVTSFDLISDD